MSVSVVIPVHNGAATIERAVLSAVTQPAIEVLVIDDASTDDTADIVSRLCREHDTLTLVTSGTKADDWQQNAAQWFDTLKGTHVICMGADDKLEAGVIDSVCRYPDAAVVFHDYYTCGTDGLVNGGVTNGFDAVTDLSPVQMRHRVRERPYASETGIGSAVRRDHLLWLNSLQWWNMGPWSDAIGYAAVAIKHGAVFVPGSGATFTVNDEGYGNRERTGARAARYHDACRAFLAAADVPFSVAAALCLKRGIPYG